VDCCQVICSIPRWGYPNTRWIASAWVLGLEVAVAAAHFFVVWPTQPSIKRWSMLLLAQADTKAVA